MLKYIYSQINMLKKILKDREDKALFEWNSHEYNRALGGLEILELLETRLKSHDKLLKRR